MSIKKIIKILWLCYCISLLYACDNKPWNSPYPKNQLEKNDYFSSFSAQPKTLDPAKSYSVDEHLFTAQIYEPPLQYQYNKTPYTLIPLTITKMPQITYLDKNNQILSANAPPEQIAYTIYELHIKPHIFYQPHPAFMHTKRELIADDYVYEIKRLANPKVGSPIFGLMSEHIVGLKELSAILSPVKQPFIDLRRYDLSGVKLIDRYTYQIKLIGKYPQFLYWLTMPFFAPIPWEVDQFYSRPENLQRITLDWYPIGTGPYMLTENNPNRRMVLTRNPNFHGEVYAGHSIPYIDHFIFTLEKESIPRWNKFLQGYYDQSGVSSDNFDQAIKIDMNGNAVLSNKMRAENLKLYTSVSPGNFYIGFNMLDDIVGGYSEKAKKLRQAISIAVNYEEFISIFLNGRGAVAKGPIPPTIWGFSSDYNPYVYTKIHNTIKRKNLLEAKKLLQAAGFPDGRHIKTGEPLILNLDVPASGNPDDQATFEWLRNQFNKLDIQLNIRATDYNRFQEKMRTGNAQLYMWGWRADYPDPENFLFLLDGANGKVKYGGENASNYDSPSYNTLFNRMKTMPNNQERLAIIQQMLVILQEDAPWIWGFFPVNFQLAHQWVLPYKPDEIITNQLKYWQIDPKLRVAAVNKWNRPLLWPLWILIGLFIAALLPVAISYWLHERNVKNLKPIRIK
jgi:ABC-type transport system substrate-binding protein